MPTTRVFLCRHGETGWNREGRYQGFQDIPLNERGAEQAKQLATFLKNIEIHAFYASPLSRARETAVAIVSAKKLDPAVIRADQGFAEISHGSHEGMLAADVERDNPGLMRAWRAAPHTVVWPKGESVEMVQARAIPAFEKAVRDNPGKSILIAAHDAVNKVLLLWAASSPLSKFWVFKQDSTCLNVIDVVQGDNGVLSPSIVMTNSLAHTGKVFADLVHKAL
ncbi:MAG: histidine phosphatase family protein [Planctomycetaceae bacterium]|nr:histidine phosphatase family protein [Planctomycetaceae bacterium]